MPTTALNALLSEALPPCPAAREAITTALRRSETACVNDLLASLQLSATQQTQLRPHARALIEAVRAKRRRAGGVDALMQEFSLDSAEGVALMCLAEALLRIPDAATRDALIRDKIAQRNWRAHLGHSASPFVNAAAWGLLITGKLLSPCSEEGLGSALKRLTGKGGEPLIRRAMEVAMRVMGNQFVAGQTIDAALERAREPESRGYLHSFDMLGETALTEEDAARYARDYAAAIHAVGRAAQGRGVAMSSGISIKLSALHPRFCRAQREWVFAELLPVLKSLAKLAAGYDIGLNIDAEESDRLDLCLDLFEALVLDPELRPYQGLGIVVQAYLRRAPRVIDWLIDLATRADHRIMVRLVKGAYWDSEIKRAQVDGMSDYPVFTRKPYTDLSYLVCAQKLLARTDILYPQFATHNALTLTSVAVIAQGQGATAWEFQCLHGMGETLYDEVLKTPALARTCRIYAPVGSHETLLAYLVRRLLENGANSSFVARIVDEAVPIDELLADPAEFARTHQSQPHPRIASPSELFAPWRKNSRGIDWSDESVLRSLGAALAQHAAQQWQALPGISGEGAASTMGRAVLNPADHDDVVGWVVDADPQMLEATLTQASHYAPRWAAVPVETRAVMLERAADALEAQQVEFMALAVREAGKTLLNAQGEVREAVDFLRYYAVQARQTATGTPRGVIACISPWNFPLAIFTGQLAAALVTGNTVIAKPAEQTPLIAARMVGLLHAAGIPAEALCLLPGQGETIGAALCADARVAGIMFTGSTEVAAQISAAQTKLAGERMLIAETGGQNAMIVDASALPEQAVADALQSAFDSAGQRCSALRVLCLQDEIASHTLDLLGKAAMQLQIGDPACLKTDIGPLIDAEACQRVEHYLASMQRQGHRITRLALPPALAPRRASYCAPAIVEIDDLSQLSGEVFGPVLHVLRWQKQALPALIEAINGLGYGLTMGVHSRIDEMIDYVAQHAKVGNLYVNRNMIGAVVGMQPFGGEGLSGTGPKAGGPLYLRRLQRAPVALPTPFDAKSIDNQTWQLPAPTGEANLLRFIAKEPCPPGGNPFPIERTISRNLAASGGNASLMTLEL